jgi:hypothetical protein
MNFILEIIKKVLYLIPFVLILAFLFMLVKFTFKSLNISPTLSSISKKDFLPAPGTFKMNVTPAPTPTDTPTNPTMEELNPWMKNGAYTSLGRTVDYTQANSQVRDIVIGTNNTIHSGTVITGTARDVFFSGGRFFVLVLNESGQMIASTVATAQDVIANNSWTPWEARLSTVPRTVSGNCILVLQNENTTGNPQLTKVIRIPAACY